MGRLVCWMRGMVGDGWGVMVGWRWEGGNMWVLWMVRMKCMGGCRKG